MAGILEGLKVVSLEQAVAAPYCSSRLAEAGARVIKVERKEGDFARQYDHVVHGESAYFVWLNRGKESLAIDIKNPEDAALLHRIVDQSDIYIQNLAPGAAERAGFGSQALRERNPSLITCDISGYGDEGSYRDMRAYDLLVQCESGLASITGSPEAPGRVGVSIADVSCGMYANAAILQALLKRGRTGEGESLKVSLFSSLADWMTVPLLHFDYAGREPLRSGLNHPSIAPYGAYSTGDGRTIVIAIQNEREWSRFCEVVLGDCQIAGDPELNSNSQRVANRKKLDQIISRIFNSRTHNQVIQLLKQGDIAHGSFNSVGDLSGHPQLQRTTVGSPSGPVKMPVPPVSGWQETTYPGDIPALGAHTQALRREFAADT